MATGDTNYQWLSSGSVSTSADTAHNLWGSYGGLSDQNANEVVHIQVHASKNPLYLFPSVDASGVQLGQKFLADLDFYQDLPPMKVSDASQLSIVNYTAGNNTEMAWVIWVRRQV